MYMLFKILDTIRTDTDMESNHNWDEDRVVSLICKADILACLYILKYQFIFLTLVRNRRVRIMIHLQAQAKKAKCFRCNITFSRFL
jgi:hypothetical protein